MQKLGAGVLCWVGCGGGMQGWGGGGPEWGWGVNGGRVCSGCGGEMGLGCRGPGA